MIRQGQVDLKVWIPRPFFKRLKQILQVALGVNKSNLASHSQVWFVIFTTSAKASGVCYQNIAKLLTPCVSLMGCVVHTQFKGYMKNDT